MPQLCWQSCMDLADVRWWVYARYPGTQRIVVQCVLVTVVLGARKMAPINDVIRASILNSGARMSAKTIYKVVQQKERDVFICLLASLIILSFSSAIFSQDETKKHVLILHSYHKGQQWNDGITKGIESVFNENGQNIELFFEYMDTKRFYDDNHLENLAQLLKNKYRSQTLDVIISSDDHAYNFLLKNSETIFPEVPIVFCGVNRLEESSLNGRKWFTGVVESTDLEKTIEVAIQLYPKTKNIFVLVDKTVSGMAHRRQIEDITSHFDKIVVFDLLEDVELSSIKKKLQELPKDSIVLWLNLFSDKNKSSISLDDVSILLRNYCDVPAYSLWDNRLGEGIVGGKMISGFAQGKTAARMAQKILQGEKIEDIQIMRKSPNPYKFDYDQMLRFDIEISDLPVGSIVINQPFSFYSEHKRLVWIVASSIVGLSAIIIILMLNMIYRKRAEKALRESEEKMGKLYAESRRAAEVYHSVLHTSADAILTYDMAGKVTYVNPSFTEIFGWALEEVEGENLHFVPESEKKASMAGIKRIEEEGKSIQGFETKRYVKDGRIIDVSMSGSRYNDHEGNPIGMLVVIRDISENKKLEAQLQNARKMEAIGTLAGGVAHDLNNILGGLVSYPELLLLQLPKDNPLRKSILTIQKSGEKAAAVVQDLLTLARRGVVVTEVVNLNKIIAEYLKSPEHEKLQSYHPGVHIETHLKKDTLNILGSSIHLSKTVMNLVSNAAEAMPEGGALTVSTQNRYIDRHIRGYVNVNEGDYVVLTISDTGIGISPEDMGKIFEPFYTKKKMGRSGTGLGMAVVWGTVKDHNGYIDVQSTEGRGTTFTLYFPATREKLSEDKSHLAIGSYSGDGESILVIDDVEEQRKIASGMLKELGYSVAMVSSGEEAVEYLKINKVDLLVLDMIMDPGMDGLDTYKKILEIHHGQKAIIASGFSETDRVKEAQSLGAITYVRKPFLLEKIGLAVKEELEK